MRSSDWSSDVCSSDLLWSTAVTVVANGVSRLATSDGRGLGRVVGFFSDLPGRIVRAIGSIGSLLYNAGRNVVQGLIDGIYAMLGWHTSAASSMDRAKSEESR